MGDVHFYTKKPNRNGLCLIYLKFKYNGQSPFIYCFGQCIDPKNWNDKIERVKRNNTTTADGKRSLNDLLDNLKRTCETAYNKEISNGIPHRSVLKKYMDDFMNQNLRGQASSKTLLALFKDFTIGKVGRSKNPGTWAVFDAVLKHLEMFETAKKFPVDFNSIDMDFFYKFTKYLQSDLNLKDTTINKDIKILKMVMSEAVELGHTKNLAFKSKKFNYPANETDAVYLSDEELWKLFEFNLSHDKRLERVKHQFLFGCYTGLRFSDFNRVKKNHIFKEKEGLVIKIQMKKVKGSVQIPCPPIAQNILERYDYNIPSRDISDLNKEIKNICKLAGFTQTGRLLSDENKELWRCISSHTCRRSFATNAYKKGISPNLIMKITGHKSPASFFKYIKIEQSDAAKRFREESMPEYKKQEIQLQAFLGSNLELNPSPV